MTKLNVPLARCATGVPIKKKVVSLVWVCYYRSHDVLPPRKWPDVLKELETRFDHLYGPNSATSSEAFKNAAVSTALSECIRVQNHN